MQNFSNITAVILAGGPGTRLKTAVPDRPKVLAEVCNRPFLMYILDQILSMSIRKVVLCTGYMADKVKKRLGDVYGSLRLLYSKEDKPLGTGGALRLALSYLSSDVVIVMNGDSYIDTNLTIYINWFSRKGQDVALLLTKVPDTTRYGKVTVGQNGRITGFAEKESSSGAGFINAGIYILRKSLIANIPTGLPYSLEYEFFPTLVKKKLLGFCCEGRFIDIGTPDSYAEAQDFFAGNKSRKYKLCNK